MIELINDITDMDDMTSNDNSIKDDENENSKIDETHADESNGEELAIRQVRVLKSLYFIFVGEIDQSASEEKLMLYISFRNVLRMEL